MTRQSHNSQTLLTHIVKVSALAAAVSAIVIGCGGGSGNAGSASPLGSDSPTVRASAITASNQSLSVADVNLLLGRAIQKATELGKPATIAIVDRVGNVLALYQMTGAPADLSIDGDKGAVGGLDGAVIAGGAPFAAIAKAITGAYLSSSGNAFSTRTASLIVQENFYPQEKDQPSGPLFGVQFSSLPCSDLVLREADGTQGPKRSPLGLSADPGGFPLYKNGMVVGGIGIFADGKYGLDRDPRVEDADTTDEQIAWAALGEFAAPEDIRANRISLGGPFGVFTDVTPATAGVAAVDPARLLALAGYKPTAPVRAGVAFGQPASGYVADPSGTFTDVGGFILSRPNNPAYPIGNGVPRSSPTGSPSALTQAEVTELLRQAIMIANRARAQIRRPVGTPVEVTISVTDNDGNLLGVIRTPDAPVFGTDVSLQKARTAVFFSRNDAATLIRNNNESYNYLFLKGGATVSTSLSGYMDQSATFFNNTNAFNDGIAYSARAIGNISRPFYPDGPNNGVTGPLSKPFANWSPFNDGFQLDQVYNQIFGTIFDTNPSTLNNTGCTALNKGANLGKKHLANGSQIFPGGTPIYRGNTLVGGIGISGDGVDQDDMVAFLGLSNASRTLSAAGNNPAIALAPAPIRASTLAPQGQSLRFVQCPTSPFNNSTENNVCGGL